MNTVSSHPEEVDIPHANHANGTTLVITFSVLMLLLAATVAAGMFLEGTLGTVTGLGISVIKTILIAAIFMNLRGAAANAQLAALAAILWLSLAFLFILGDYATRGWHEPEDQRLEQTTINPL